MAFEKHSGKKISNSTAFNNFYIRYCLVTLRFKVGYEGIETMLLRNIDGSWKIVHIHWSN
jgi:hypothetical protein